MDIEEKRKLTKYQERLRFWTDKRISQLSIHNNLMLTISIAIVGYLWSERVNNYEKLIFDLHLNIDWTVIFYLGAMVSIGVSVVSGFLLSASRLYDLRLTCRILLVRKKALKNNIKLEKNDNECSFGILKSLYRSIVLYDNTIIENKEFLNKNLDLVNENFQRLRVLSSCLGKSTWKLLNIQTFTLSLSILLFLISTAIK